MNIVETTVRLCKETNIYIELETDTGHFVTICSFENHAGQRLLDLVVNDSKVNRETQEIIAWLDEAPQCA